jgi:hypothetical protein
MQPLHIVHPLYHLYRLLDSHNRQISVAKFIVRFPVRFKCLMTVSVDFSLAAI